MLFVLVHKIVKNPLVKLCDPFKIISTSWFIADYFINELVALMGKICDVLLSEVLLLNIC